MHVFICLIASSHFLPSMWSMSFGSLSSSRLRQSFSSWWAFFRAFLPTQSNSMKNYNLSSYLKQAEILSFYLSIYLSICLPVYLSVYLSTYPTVFISIYLSSYLSVCIALFSTANSICHLNLLIVDVAQGNLFKSQPP